MNLVTGIILEHVLKISHEEEKTRSAKLEVARALTLLRLHQLFLQLDVNGDGVLNLEELQTAIFESSEIKGQLRKLEISMLDIEELFKLLDLEGNGEINVAEFVSGAARSIGPASARQLLGIQYDLQRSWGQLLEMLEATCPPGPRPELPPFPRTSSRAWRPDRPNKCTPESTLLPTVSELNHRLQSLELSSVDPPIWRSHASSDEWPDRTAAVAGFSDGTTGPVLKFARAYTPFVEELHLELHLERRFTQMEDHLLASFDTRWAALERRNVKSALAPAEGVEGPTASASSRHALSPDRPPAGR